MPRLLFTKEGSAVWMSHLDLMRALMRSFRRAGIDLKHSQGFTPHPELSILMPLSVGVESQCEIAEFALAEGCTLPLSEVPPRLNPVLPAGIRALDCYEGGGKAGKLAWLRARLSLIYDSGIPAGARQAIAALFARPDLRVEKHSKKGPVEVDIIPMLREVAVAAAAEGEGVLPAEVNPGRILEIQAVCSAQNPTLNPLLLATALETCLPELKPDYVRCRRLEIYDADLQVFR